MAVCRPIPSVLPVIKYDLPARLSWRLQAIDLYVHSGRLVRMHARLDFEEDCDSHLTHCADD